MRMRENINEKKLREEESEKTPSSEQLKRIKQKRIATRGSWQIGYLLRRWRMVAEQRFCVEHEMNAER